MRKKALPLCLSVLYLLGAFQAGCRRQRAETPLGSLTGQSGCKMFWAGFAPTDEEECVAYRYAGNILRLTHRNAAFNCCPGKITAEIAVSGQTISIREAEQEAGCHCLCLYDLEMEISGLPPGIYRVILTGPCLGDQPALDFVLDLEPEGEGEYCVDRNGSPWKAAA